jgi:hypothetical protein
MGMSRILPFRFGNTSTAFIAFAALTETSEARPGFFHTSDFVFGLTQLTSSFYRIMSGTLTEEASPRLVDTVTLLTIPYNDENFQHGGSLAFDDQGNLFKPGTPNARPALHAYAGSAAINGPIYRYDPGLNEEGTGLVGIGRVFKHRHLYHPIDLRFGPEGSLYVVQYGPRYFWSDTTSIIRIRYAGNATCAEAVSSQVKKKRAPANTPTHVAPWRSGPHSLAGHDSRIRRPAQPERS